MSAPIRAGVIGAGPAALAMHLPVMAQLRDQGEIELSWICDLQPERAEQARREFGFHRFAGDAAALAADPDTDAVYIFASAQLHYDCGMSALCSGKHLFVEKPVAPSYRQVQALVQAAQARSLIAVGGLNRRFYRALDAVRARGGNFRWRFAEAVFHKAEFGKRPAFGARTWLGANGVHALDALLYVMGGRPELLSSFAATANCAEPALFSAQLQWRDGSQASFLCNNAAGSRREEYVFHAFGESLTVNGSELIVDKDGRRLTERFESVGDGIHAEHAAFLSAIHSGIAPRHSLEAIAPTLLIAELIESGYTGRIDYPALPDLPLAQTRTASPRSVLVTQPQQLQVALARWLPQTRLVTLQDLESAPAGCSEVTAAILGHGSKPLPESLLARLPNLSVVGIAALSLERYAPGPVLARGIDVVNASAAYADSVAEFALGLAILGRRRAFASHRVMLAGGWGTQSDSTGKAGWIRSRTAMLRPLLRKLRLEHGLTALWRRRQSGRKGLQQCHTLRGAMVGLVGWGANATAFTHRLRAAGARVLVYSEHAQRTEIETAGARPASLAEVLSADIVSLHRTLTQQTRHCLGAPELARLKSGAVLINVARGELIESGALLARLRTGDVFACLDTFVHEPLGARDPLRRLPNVFLTAHIAGGSPDMHLQAADEVVRKVAHSLQAACSHRPDVRGSHSLMNLREKSSSHGDS